MAAEECDKLRESPYLPGASSVRNRWIIGIHQRARVERRRREWSGRGSRRSSSESEPRQLWRVSCASLHHQPSDEVCPNEHRSGHHISPAFRNRIIIKKNNPQIGHVFLFFFSPPPVHWLCGVLFCSNERCKHQSAQCADLFIKFVLRSSLPPTHRTSRTCNLLSNTHFICVPMQFQIAELLCDILGRRLREAIIEDNNTQTAPPHTLITWRYSWTHQNTDNYFIRRAGLYS